MIYVCNEAVSVKELADLRESIGWNKMENEYKNPLYYKGETGDKVLIKLNHNQQRRNIYE